jgi:hypothetical protein
MIMESKKIQRKFFLACVFTFAAISGMYIPPYPIKQDGFLWTAGLMMVIYGAMNILAKYGWPSFFSKK